jgi:hypothetical protein
MVDGIELPLRLRVLDPRQQPLRALKDQLILIRDGKFRDGKVDFAAQAGKLPQYGMVASASVCWTTGKR